MGWLEAVVVVYIRGLLRITRTDVMPTTEEILRRMAELPWLVRTEQTREVATIVMLGAVAWLAARRLGGRLGAFLICFGVWDIVYYTGLFALLGWPPSLTTKDVLFLIPPHPWWYQPVWLPIAISVFFVGLGSVLLARSDAVAARTRNADGA